MLPAVRAVYNGTSFIPDESINYNVGDEAYILLVKTPKTSKKPPVDLSQFVIPYDRGEKGEHIDAQEYVKWLRDNDRI